MKKVLTNITDFIGSTPMIELRHVWNGKAKGRILAKMEFVQPGGSIKDRAALQIIKDAYKNGKLTNGQPVVEMTSGNMGAGLAVVCGAMGNPFIATMSEGNSPERRRIFNALGAELVLVPQVDGTPGKVTGNDIAGAVEKAKEIARERNAFYVDQFNNPSCVTAHYTSTGPEIWNTLEGKIDAFLASIGTGATFIGTSRYLKEQNKNIYCAAVEPEKAAILKKGYVENPKHIIQGTGYCLVPPLWDPKVADEIITVTDEEVKQQTRLLAEKEGLYVGYSSGANVCAAVKLIESGVLKENPIVVTVLCDTAYKYSEL
ncbi:MAG: pyridoxal-phosphate dependent enzyme [Candidatus Aminicenantes bacterium]|nr:pyridoxal-phosphate dependent enzyme [Candidatus Aminicenantes bacterium]NIM79011.1 pyridoxal-phosphate dependent enzyme [Candidatus Aminicenantes bacterium]NIN18269.1 pyridoxal-phosphate dependent enzyme [Candidatus Aminicenantes bacterium]NIN42166.1 pyridoxal-phosphate dependent enzyme [Candidatus Aminicenantes bacterium]NIN84922.1 pyridoxal-phosphate dependent enzyme [Candidatus Aminicenantes bacterium]